MHSHVLSSGCSSTCETGAYAVAEGTGELHEEVAQIPMTTLVTLLDVSQQSPTVSWIVPRAWTARRGGNWALIYR